MYNKISGNFVLCKSYDIDKNSFNNLFDNLYLNSEMLADFVAVLQINVYSSTDYQNDKYFIYSFLKENTNQNINVSYLGCLNLPPKNDFDHTQSDYSHRHRQIYNFSGFVFPTTGNYVIECYVLEEQMDINNDNVLEKYAKLENKNCKLDALTFSVQIKAD